MYHGQEVKFTKHALERIESRKITQEMVIETVLNPDKSYDERDGGMKFIRNVDGRLVHVVCMPLVEERKWLVKSAWIRGEDNEGNQEVYKPQYELDYRLVRLIRLAIFILLLIAIVVGLIYFSSN